MEGRAPAGDCLLECWLGDIAGGGEVRQIGFDFRRAHVLRVTHFVEADKSDDPVQVGFFGRPAVVQDADSIAHPVKQARLLNDRRCVAFYGYRCRVSVNDGRHGAVLRWGGWS